LDDLDIFKRWLKTKQGDYVLEEGSELWVGANLVRGVWKWDGETDMEFNGRH